LSCEEAANDAFDVQDAAVYRRSEAEGAHAPNPIATEPCVAFVYNGFFERMLKAGGIDESSMELVEADSDERPVACGFATAHS
jgi:hypothetical protein